MSSTSDVDRKRRSRQRAREGLLPVMVEVHEAEWTSELIEAGFLPPLEQANKIAIGRALSRVLELLLSVGLAELLSRRDTD